jgi:hypothetical protein
MQRSTVDQSGVGSVWLQRQEPLGHQRFEDGVTHAPIDTTEPLYLCRRQAEARHLRELPAQSFHRFSHEYTAKVFCGFTLAPNSWLRHQPVIVPSESDRKARLDSSVVK